MKKDLAKFNKSQLLDMLNHLDDDTKALFQQYIDQSIKEILQGRIEDIWFNREGAISYWLLLIDGVDNKQESKMANELLFWNEFHAGGDARVRCIQSSDRIINKFCIKHFKIINPPVLIFSKDPLFTNHIMIKSELLSQLIKEENKLRNFINKIHSQISNGKSLKEINKEFSKVAFWNGLKVVYEEIKLFASISIKADYKLQ